MLYTDSGTKVRTRQQNGHPAPVVPHQQQQSVVPRRNLHYDHPHYQGHYQPQHRGHVHSSHHHHQQQQQQEERLHLQRQRFIQYHHPQEHHRQHQEQYPRQSDYEVVIPSLSVLRGNYSSHQVKY